MPDTKFDVFAVKPEAARRRIEYTREEGPAARAIGIHGVDIPVD